MRSRENSVKSYALLERCKAWWVKKTRWILSDNINPRFKEILTRSFWKGYIQYIHQRQHSHNQNNENVIKSEDRIPYLCIFLLLTFVGKLIRFFFLWFRQICSKFRSMLGKFLKLYKKHFVNTKETFVSIFSSKISKLSTENFLQTLGICEKNSRSF